MVAQGSRCDIVDGASISETGGGYATVGVVAQGSRCDIVDDASSRETVRVYIYEDMIVVWWISRL